ncbi:hypothetical protein E2562_011429 [Oryza meyeriana var. granulata]|uniref:Uncharacterized protein n=1 Tax=Oryza meyeriana var. granulata TaxID=110450 RepID=A0A6G1D221_9ORYZ|nr:hypothetical protein E2562_011429 [Oryza meyeriana var. granulata]
MSKHTENVLVDVAVRVAQPEASWCNTTTEEQLNCFVRVVASVERAGNALGTLAFTWATVVLLGGLQIPAAVMRVIIALTRLLHQNYYGKGGHANDPDKKNLKPTLNVFYGMVLGQGILYLVARILDFFSFFPRR